MTRQFHAHVVRRAPKPKPREPRPHTVSFKCFRFVAIDDRPEDYEIIELCDPRNAMRVLVFEREIRVQPAG